MRPLLLLLASLAATLSHAAEREMSTDRPDKTESPYTVPKGMVQMESDLAAYTYDKHNADDVTLKAWNFGSLNFKYGVADNVDFQVVFDGYLNEKTEDRATGVTSRHDGVGDLTARLKVNLWGNDGGSTALALMPFVKVPTASHGLGNDEVEGGLIIPLAVELAKGWGMGIMTEVDITADEGGGGHHAEFVNSVTVGHDLTEKLGAYVEFWSLISAENSSDWQGSVDVGLTYALTDNLQVDAGCNFGVTESAEDVHPFVGLSYRF